MRSMQEMLFQPIRPDAPLSNLEAELCALGVAEDKVFAFTHGLIVSLGESPDPHIAKEVMLMALAQDPCFTRHFRGATVAAQATVR